MMVNRVERRLFERLANRDDISWSEPALAGLTFALTPVGLGVFKQRAHLTITE